MLKNKNVLFYILLSLGIALIISSIVLFAICNDHTGGRGGVVRASTSTEYGADFYTDSSNYTGLAANAATDIYKLVKCAFAILFLFVGSVEVCVLLLLKDCHYFVKNNQVNPLDNSAPCDDDDNPQEIE